jgi:outer membrane lipopolysaccharide assembly protein LptE/RlpB
VRTRLALPIAALALLVGGCGYSLVRYGDGLGEVRSVAVPTPENDSYEAGVDLIVADALRREFLRRRGVRLVEDPARADLVLDGRVVAVEGRARSFSSIAQALEYELTLSLALEARRADGTEIELDARSLRETERYLASADAEALRKNREEALRQAAAVLAGRVYDALYETLTP